ncbi:hypothetical protein V2G26_019702 [Clonostachys chloroleuca]
MGPTPQSNRASSQYLVGQNSFSRGPCLVPRCRAIWGVISRRVLGALLNEINYCYVDVAELPHQATRAPLAAEISLVRLPHGSSRHTKDCGPLLRPLARQKQSFVFSSSCRPAKSPLPSISPKQEESES